MSNGRKVFYANSIGQWNKHLKTDRPSLSYVHNIAKPDERAEEGMLSAEYVFVTILGLICMTSLYSTENRVVLNSKP